MRQMVPPHTKFIAWSYCVQSLLGAPGGLASPLPLHVLVGQVALKILHLQKVLSRDSPVTTGHLPPCGLGCSSHSEATRLGFSSSVEIRMNQQAGEACCPSQGSAGVSMGVHTRTLYRGKPRLRGHDCKVHPGQCHRAGTRSLAQSPHPPPPHHSRVLGILLGCSRLSLQQGGPRPCGGT